MNDDKFAIIVKSLGHDLNDSETESLMSDLNEAVGDVFGQYGIEFDQVETYDGDIYSQTDMHMSCPDCSDPLNVQQGEFGPQNGAQAEVNCDCGYTGTALYRVIDYVHEIDQSQQRLNEFVNDTDEEMPDSYESAVSEGKVDVIYNYYESTDYKSSETRSAASAL